MNRYPWFFKGPAPKSTDWTSIWKEAVNRFGGLPAFRLVSGVISYKETDRMAAEVSRELSSSTGWSRGSLVSLSSLDPAYPWKAIGIWLAGGVIVPFNKDVCDGKPALRSAVGSISEWVLDIEGKPSQMGRKIEETIGWHAVYFTSGSTGEPKGVVRGWDQALFEAGHYATLIEAGPGMTCTMLIDPAFGASTKHFLGCLLSGCVQIMPEDAVRLPRGGHLLYGTPAHLLSFFASDTFSRPGYTWISLTGEPCSSAAWKAVLSLGSQVGRCLNALGGTEFGVALNMVIPLAGQTEPPPSFIGSPLPQKSISLLDENGSTIRAGESGLLCVTSSWIAKGYLDLDGESPRFRPFLTENLGRHFLSGDVAVSEGEGLFRLLGRSGSMLKRHGVWVDTAPLRNLLLGASCGVSETVIVTNDEGSGFSLLIEMTDLDAISVENALFLVLETFSTGELIPTEVIGLRKLPRNRHGKVDLKQLSEMMKSPESPDLVRRIPASRIDRIASAIRMGDFSSSLLEGVSTLGDLELDSLELHELASVLAKSSGRQVPIELLLAPVSLHDLAASLQGNDHSGFTRHGDSSKRRCILWFGPGAVSLVRYLGGECEIRHWNCDWITARQGGNGEGSLTGLAGRLLSMNPGMAPSREVLVGGFSFGAMIAHEASLILSRKGSHPLVTILLDPPDLRTRLIRSYWRWSRWRPFLLRFLLRAFIPVMPGAMREKLREMEKAQWDGCIREIHRNLMRHHVPSRREGSTVLLTSREFHSSSCDLFAKCAVDLNVVPLPVNHHGDVLESPESIMEWIGVIALHAGKHDLKLPSFTSLPVVAYCDHSTPKS